MFTSAVFFALIGTLQCKAAISTAISYEPIKITVNENFNAQPGQVRTEFQSLEPGVVHQGANFYFKPRFNLPSSSITHHIEALMSLIQQHHSCAKDATKVVFEKDKLMEILMPFLYPKEALSDTVMEEENNSEIVVPVPILIIDESKPAIPEHEVTPEAPVLPPLSFDGIPPIVEEEVKKEESVILEESTIVLNEVPPKPARLELVIIPEAPVLPPLSANDIHIDEEVKVVEPITLTRPKPIVVDVESKSATPNLLVIPEAPVLPAQSLNGMPSIVEEEVIKEESVLLEELTDIFPTKPAITVGPITEPIITYVEPNPNTSGLLGIPEAPILPSLSFNGMASFVEKEVKKEESIILEESTDESQEPTIIEVEPKPATPELVIIPEAPILPTLSANDIRIVEKVNIEEPITLPMPKPIFVDFEPKFKTSELVVIPEAPMPPPLSFNGMPSLPLLSFKDIPSFVEEKLKKKESIILEQQTGVFPTIPEITVGPITDPIINYGEPKSKTSELPISEAPVLPPLSYKDIRTFVEEEMEKKESIILKESTRVSQEPTIIEIEPKPATPELEVIPEAPVLTPLSFNGIPASFEEVKKEKLVLLKESTGESQAPTLIDIEPKPTISELVVIPEAPVLPPFSANDIHIVEEVKIEEPISLPMLESIVVDIEPKPVTPELPVFPEAPMLPLLPFNGIPAFVEEEVKNEESVILEESTSELQEPTIIEVNHKPATPEFETIREVLQSLSFEDIRTIVKEEKKNKKSIRLEGSTGESQPKPATPELEGIPEAPMLPPLSFNGIPSVVETEVKKEESVIPDESTGVLQMPTVSEVEPKPASLELVVIPETPVLPPMSEMPVVEKVKSTDSIPEIFARPTLETFVETETAESFALENNIFPVATEDIEIPILLKESIEVFPPIAEISSGPTLLEPEITNSYMAKKVSQPNSDRVATVQEALPPTIIRKPSNNLGVFSYAPILSHLSNRALKTKKRLSPKPASLERFLLKKHPFRLHVKPFPKLSLNDMESPILGNKNQFLYPTSYAHDFLKKRIAPMAFKKNSPPKRVKMYVRSNVSKGPSYL